MFASRRLSELPRYAFSALEDRVAELSASGRSVIDLGRADPDHEAPEPAIAALLESARQPEAHRYPPLRGIPEFRRAVARWYQERHGVTVDPDSEVVALAGSKEGLFLISLAVCDPGDVALVPDPSYPAYRMGAYFAGAEVVSTALRPELGYLPDLAALPEGLARRARVMFVNYPNNPTGATATSRWLTDAVAFARRFGTLVCNDFSYGDSGFEGYRAPSLLSVEGAKETAVEFISFSKSFCMAGLRLGAAVGNAAAVAALLDVLAQIQGGVFAAVQQAGVVALDQVGHSGLIASINQTYRARRDVMMAALEDVGIRVRRPRATPYLWVPTPDERPSLEFASWLIERTGVALAPGSAFGAGGEGFFRLSLTAPTVDIEEAAARLRRLGPEGIRAGRGVGQQWGPRPGYPQPTAARQGREGAAAEVGPSGVAPDALLGSL